MKRQNCKCDFEFEVDNREAMETINLTQDELVQNLQTLCDDRVKHLGLDIKVAVSYSVFIIFCSDDNYCGIYPNELGFVFVVEMDKCLHKLSRHHRSNWFNGYDKEAGPRQKQMRDYRWKPST